jgi:hypothetical protein
MTGTTVQNNEAITSLLIMTVAWTMSRTAAGPHQSIIVVVGRHWCKNGLVLRFAR